MGLYDDITPDTLRADLYHFAQLILRLEADGRLLEATPRLLKLLGDLRAKIFAYEVRVTGRLAPRSDDASGMDENRRVVEEAIQRIRDAAREWSRTWDPEDPAQ